MLLLLATLLGPMPVTTDTTVPVRPGSRLELSTIEGSITVTTWTRQAVRVESDGDDEESEVEVRVRGTTITVQGGGHGPLSSDITLTVPADLDLDLSSQEGDIRVEGVKGSLDIQATDGSIEVRGGTGNITLESVDGDIRLTGARGRVTINATDGQVTIHDCTGDIRVSSVDGEIEMLDIEAASVYAETVDGAITYQGTIQDGGRYHLTSHDGDVTVAAPVINAVITVSTFSGSFESDFDVTLSHGVNKDRMTFTLGTGKAQMELESFDGMVALRKR